MIIGGRGVICFAEAKLAGEARYVFTVMKMGMKKIHMGGFSLGENWEGGVNGRKAG